jgi:uncharacterized protein (DUF1800 family)
MALDTERGKVAHLLRRATFGPSADEIDAAAKAGLNATIDRLLNPERESDDFDQRFPADGFDFIRNQDAIRYWVLRMIHGKRQFQEKLTLFWHGHLTSALSKTGGPPNGARMMLNQIDLYRRMGLGGFRELVIASAKDPAMIRWLDSNQNRKGKPNENYARELFELFMLGIGNYSEQDVREAARAFTGWFERNGEFIFVANQHDTGSKTVLGHTGNWDGGDIVDIAIRQPACGHYIARALWEFFAYRSPETEVVSEIAEIFVSSGWNIRATMQAIFTHPAFYSEKAYHALVKSPLEYLIGFTRSFNAKTDAMNFQNFLAPMGQVPLNPPDVNGWPGQSEWVSTTALIYRYNVANGLLRSGADQSTYIDVAGLLQARGLRTADAILDFFIDLMVDGDLPAAKRKVLADYLVAKDDGKPGTFTLDERIINNKVRGLIYLLAATPEYQLN